LIELKGSIVLKIKQYGKSSTSLIKQKQSFFNENDKHIEEQRKISKIYVRQPIRLYCKNCDHSLKVEHDFIKDGIKYKICDTCTHLNGSHEDTDEFCNIVYAGDDGKDYAQNYEVSDIANFNYRLSSIYIPKAEFLYTSLINDHADPHNMKYLDFGSGSGYFVGALNKIGLKNISGTEVSKQQVNFGNKMMGLNVLSVHKMSDTNNLLQKTDANVVSLLGVLEHLQNPRSAMMHIQKNDQIKYVYLSVPLFSLSVFLEMMSDDVLHRQLHGGHTHLYTKKSLQYLAQEFGFDIISEWWFGTDIVDLYRYIFVSLKKNQCSDVLISSFQEMILPLIDSMQLELDKKHHSSEVHLLLRKK
jgi:2-polyprenyl-3-methyl-5-hydroxy-6-metoxy-1,4-benzoquinol methylase